MTTYMVKRSKTDLLKSAPPNVEKAERVANNTIRYRTDDGDWVIQHQDTPVVTIRPNGDIVLNSGGWRTVTTKERINRYLPEGWTLFQDGGAWYLNYDPWTDRSTWTAFYDGIKLTRFPDGKYEIAANDNGRAELLRIQEQTKLINRYCADLRKLDKLPIPDNGDCWYCLMRDVKTGETMGDLLQNTDHLLSHLQDRYIMASLILNALTWAGYPNPQFILQSDFRDSIIGTVRRYFKVRLGIAQ